MRLVARLLERERVPYALIGGVAVQLHYRRAPGPGPLKQRTAVQFSAEGEGITDVLALLEEHPDVSSAELVARPRHAA